MSDVLEAHIEIKKNGNTLTYSDRSTETGNWDGEFLNVVVPLIQGKTSLQAQRSFGKTDKLNMTILGDVITVESVADSTTIHCVNSFIFSGFML